MPNTLKRVLWLVHCILLLSILYTSMLSFSCSAHTASASVQASPKKKALHLWRKAQAPRKVIIVRLAQQQIFAYENNRLVFKAGVTTGRPSLATPVGNYYVIAKYHPTRFISPWPRWSPNWYPPTSVDYALLFRRGGFFLHDAWWRSTFGLGTNNWHNDPVFGRITGSHGCVSMSGKSAKWLYRWASVGTTVYVRQL